MKAEQPERVFCIGLVVWNMMRLRNFYFETERRLIPVKKGKKVPFVQIVIEDMIAFQVLSMELV